MCLIYVLLQDGIHLYYLPLRSLMNSSRFLPLLTSWSSVGSSFRTLCIASSNSSTLSPIHAILGSSFRTLCIASSNSSTLSPIHAILSLYLAFLIGTGLNKIIYNSIQFANTILLPVVCRRVHVLFTLFVFVCIKWCPTHIVLCFYFVFVSSSCVPYVASFSGLSIFDCPFVI